MLFALLLLMLSCAKSPEYSKVDKAFHVNDIAQTGSSQALLQLLVSHPDISGRTLDQALSSHIKASQYKDSNTLLLVDYLIDQRALQSATALMHDFNPIGKVNMVATLLHKVSEVGHMYLTSLVAEKIPQSLNEVDSGNDDAIMNLVSLRPYKLTNGEQVQNYPAILQYLLGKKKNCLNNPVQTNPVYRALACGNANLARAAYNLDETKQVHIKNICLENLHPIFQSMIMSDGEGCSISDAEIKDILVFMVETLGMDINAKDREGRPLILIMMGAASLEERGSGVTYQNSYKPNSVQYLIDKGANLNIVSKGQSPLFAWTEQGRLTDIRNNHTSDRVDINQIVDGETALHKAIDLMKWNTAVWLVENMSNAAVTSLNADGASPLNICVKRGQHKEIVPIVKQLVAKGATLSKPIRIAGNDRQARLRAQLEERINKNMLLIAALSGNKKHFLSGVGPLVMPILKEVMPASVIDINNPNQGVLFRDKTTYLEALDSILSVGEFSDLVEHWLEVGVEFTPYFHQFINKRYEWSHAIFSHVTNGYVGLVKFMLANSDTYERCLTYCKKYKRGGKTTLDIAQDNGYNDLAALLVENGFKTSAQLKGKSKKATKLPSAAADAGPSTVEIPKTVWNAIEGKVQLKSISVEDMSIRNSDGLRPIEYALEYGYYDQIPLLVKKGASLFDADNLGRSMWMVIALHGNLELLTKVLSDSIPSGGVKEKDLEIIKKGKLSPAICAILKAKGLAEHFPEVVEGVAADEEIVAPEDETRLFEKIFIFKKSQKNWESAIESRRVLKDSIIRLRYGAACDNIKHFSDGDFWQLRSGDVRVWYVIGKHEIDGEQKPCMFILDCDPHKTDSAKEKTWYERVRDFRDQNTRKNIDINVWKELEE